MSNSTFLCGKFIAAPCLLAFVILLIGTERIKGQSTHGLTLWKRGLESLPIKNCRVRIEYQEFVRAAGHSSGKGELYSTCSQEIYRRGNWCRVLTHFQIDGREWANEQCFTDQFLWILGFETSSSDETPTMSGVQGCLDVNDLHVHPTEYLRHAQLLFGLIPLGGDWSPHLAMVNFETAENNRIDHQLEGDLGRIRMALSAAGLPITIEHTSNEYMFEDGNFDRSRRDPGRVNTVFYSDIQWETVYGTLLPVSYVMERTYQITDKPTEYEGSLFVKLVEYELGVDLKDKDFLPTLNIRPGTPVRAYDVPVDCEWRNNRIQPILPGTFGSLSLYFENRPAARVLSMALLLITISVAVALGWRRYTSA